jgi:hypothetical protein
MFEVTGPKTPSVSLGDRAAAGQFGAWRTLGMQGFGPLQKLVQAAEETADNTEEIAANMNAGMAVG